MKRIDGRIELPRRNSETLEDNLIAMYRHEADALRARVRVLEARVFVLNLELEQSLPHRRVQLVSDCRG